MSNNLKLVLTGVVALIIGVVFGAMFAPASSNLGSVRYVQDKFVYGLTAGSADQFSINSSGVMTTSGALSSGALTVTGDSSIVGSLVVDEFTQGGGIITVSTTSNAYTLTQAELLGGNIISVAATANPGLTITLPATSTMTTLIPSAGDSRFWYIQNLNTVAATTTTIAAGTGVELQGTSTASATIPGAGWGSLNCYRQASTNVVCFVASYAVAD